MFYAVAYVLMSLGGFGMIMLLSREGFEADTLNDFKGLNQRSPWMAAVMALCMFSLAGIPPTVGFMVQIIKKCRLLVLLCRKCRNGLLQDLERPLAFGIPLPWDHSSIWPQVTAGAANGDLDDPLSGVSRLITGRHHFVLKPDAGTKPRIYYLE